MNLVNEPFIKPPAPDPIPQARYSKYSKPQKEVVPKAKPDLLSLYRFTMVDEMRFTNEEVIRMNITLGVTGDMFRSKGVFYTDFLAIREQKDNQHLQQ